MARPRSVCFTLNNYTVEEYQHIKDGPFTYLICQEEIGATGTPHIQGFCRVDKPTVFSTWKRMLGERAHIEASKASAQRNRAYCTKPNAEFPENARRPGTEFFEKGQLPNPGERSDLSSLAEAARDSSKSLLDIIDVDPCNFLRYHKGVVAIRSIISPDRDQKTKVFWFYGATGLGKSHTMRQLGRDAYWKQSGMWWCGYDPCTHYDVCVDEYRCNFSTFSFLLQLFDEYPLFVQSKGGNINFRARRIFISTPYSVEQTWSTRTEEDIQQLLRRIEVIVEFLPGRVKRFVKGSCTDLGADIVVPIGQPIGVIPAPETMQTE